MNSGPPALPTVRFHGRRHGRRLRPGRRRSLETILPRLRVPGGEDAIAPARLFEGAPAAVWLEIGFGAGEHLTAAAAANPDVGLIGCEPYVNGVAALAAVVERTGLRNVRIFDDDARLLLPRLRPASIARVFLLFPDPWPKKRHAERRLVSPATLDALARIMADGAELRFASDDAGYVRHTLAAATTHPAFAWRASGPADWRRRPADWPPTRYEEKARSAGRACSYLCFVRRPRRPDARRQKALRTTTPAL